MTIENTYELNHLAPDTQEANDNLDAVSVRNHPLWSLAVAIAPIINPTSSLTQEAIEALLPKLESYSKNLDLHFREEIRQRVMLYSTLATRYAALAGYCQESVETSKKYLKLSTEAHNQAIKAAKDAERSYTAIHGYGLNKVSQGISI